MCSNVWSIHFEHSWSQTNTTLSPIQRQHGVIWRSIDMELRKSIAHHSNLQAVAIATFASKTKHRWRKWLDSISLVNRTTFRDRKLSSDILHCGTVVYVMARKQCPTEYFLFVKKLWCKVAYTKQTKSIEKEANRSINNREANMEWREAVCSWDFRLEKKSGFEWTPVKGLRRR